MSVLQEREGEQLHVRGQMPVRPPRQRSPRDAGGGGGDDDDDDDDERADGVITTMNTKAAEFIPTRGPGAGRI